MSLAHSFPIRATYAFGYFEVKRDLFIPLLHCSGMGLSSQMELVCLDICLRVHDLNCVGDQQARSARLNGAASVTLENWLNWIF